MSEGVKYAAVQKACATGVIAISRPQGRSAIARKSPVVYGLALSRGVHTRNRPLQVETADFTLKLIPPYEAANAEPSSGKEPEGARAVCTASHRRHPGPVPGAAARRLVGASTFRFTGGRRCSGGADGLFRVHVLGRKPKRAVQRHRHMGPGPEPVPLISVRW